MGAYNIIETEALSRRKYSNITTDGRVISYSHFDSIRFLNADVTIQMLIIRDVHN